jgi:hypothetical protein
LESRVISEFIRGNAVALHLICLAGTKWVGKKL